jgi:hypothetical protein
MSETTYKQMLDRIDMVNGMVIDTQAKKKHVEDKYDRLKSDYN